VLGTTPTDFNFTGLYRHSKSNLDLSTYRAYDPDFGRWLNRDPIAEKGGINLYGYVANNPARFTDPRGHYGYETKYWADLSVNGNFAQRAIAWPLGIIATILTPDSVGMTGSGTAGLLAGGTVGVDRQYFRGDSCPADFTFLGHSFEADRASGPEHFVSPQLSASFQLNFGWSGDYNPTANSWAGDFKETSSSAGPVGLTYFQGGSWRGFGIGVTAGPAPISASNLTVTYTPHP
jgi:RHS repeat-associated protein